jgi:multidrug resistance protein, MATE family
MSLRSARTLRRWTREVRPTWKLALPIVSGMVGQMLMGLADTLMVGRVGVIPLAAAAFVNAVVHLPLVFSVGLLSSVSVMVSQAYGANDPEEAGEALRHGLLIASVTGVLTVAGSFALLPILHLFGQPTDVIEACTAYLLLLGASMLPLGVAHTCKLFGESLNRPWTPSLILLGGVLLNIFLNWILIYGHWGAPALGLEGAGWATLLARIATAVGLIVFAIRSPALRRFQPLNWFARFQRSWFDRLLSLGWPVATQHLLEVSAFAFAAVMMGWISADAMAAHQVAITCASTTFMFPFGVGMAVCIRVGHVWGAGQFERMRRIGFVGLGMGAGIMAIFGTLFIVGRMPLARLFVTEPEAVALTAQLFLVAALFQVADGLQVVAISALRGLSDVRVPAIIAVLAYWVVAVPAGYYLGFKADLGAVGIWIGLAGGLGTAACGLSWRFHLKSRMTERHSRKPEHPTVVV